MFSDVFDMNSYYIYWNDVYYYPWRYIIVFFFILFCSLLKYLFVYFIMRSFNDTYERFYKDCVSQSLISPTNLYTFLIND